MSSSGRKFDDDSALSGSRTGRTRVRAHTSAIPLPRPAPSAFDLDTALASLRGRRRALILPHDNPDPDSIAAAEGLRVLLEHELGIASTLALGGIVGRAENRAMVDVLGIPLVPIERIDPAKFDLIALCDTQPGSGNNSLPESMHADIVIDHHPSHGPFPGTVWCDIRSSLGASSTISYGYLNQKRIPIDARLATAFLYALKSETRDLGREATQAERDAYITLVAVADHALLYQIVSPKVPREHFVALDRAIRSARMHGDLMAVNLGALDYPDLVAEIADLMLPFERARWVVCVGYHARVVYLSIRTEDEDAHAGQLIRRVVGRDGAAGGHGRIAGGRLHAKVTTDRQLAPLYEQIVRNVCRELGAPEDRYTPLLPERK
ncbi:MAG TPA: DHH family phosphoesterase [Polyangia bacterium]|nr:DHH family phosphoesterase [Polyangia bacterium]